MPKLQNNKKNMNNSKFFIQQEAALGRALTFLQSFVAGKANFCSHLLASVAHFTVVKSQAVLIIRLGVAEVISAVTLYVLPASKRRNFYLVGYVQVQQFCVWTLLIDRRFDSNDVSVNVSRGDELIKRKRAKKTSISNLSDRNLPTPLEWSETL